MKRYPAPYLIIADRGSLLVRIGKTEILVPNKIGDGDYKLFVYDGEYDFDEFLEICRSGWEEVLFFDGEITIEENDCGTGRIAYHGSEPVSLLRDEHGNFAIYPQQVYRG